MRRSTSRSSQADRRTGGQTLWFALLVLSASPPIRLSAQELANNAGALFLLFPVGAQAVAMGQTAATLDGRGEAAFWNPAGLATIERGELALNSASLAAGATHALTVYYPSHRFGVLGGAVYLVDYGDLDRTDSASNTIARIAPRNIEFLASYATALPGSRGPSDSTSSWPRMWTAHGGVTASPRCAWASTSATSGCCGCAAGTRSCGTDSPGRASAWA